jgi:hypothetical protein
MTQLSELLLCPLSPPIDSELLKVLQNDLTEDIDKPSLQKQFVFVVFFLYYLTDLFSTEMTDT